MNKIFIYTGPRNAFESFVDQEAQGERKTLSTLVREIDDAKRNHLHLTTEQAQELKDEEKPVIHNLVVYSNEYASVNEHVIFNMEGFLSRVEIDKLFFQNPPKVLHDKIMNSYSEVVLKSFEYPVLSKDILTSIQTEFNSVIIDQGNVKEKLLKAFIPQIYGINNKPIIVMFFGPSGVGKTEAAKYISLQLGGKILRKQMSMFQSSDFMSYLFGGTIHDKCFARDLLDRETNVILLDEFDKANTVFHSAFYQLFDEGLFVDSNYSVNVGNPIIICTSNYTGLQEIKKHLGDPIYSRFDSFIEFEKLSPKGALQIVKKIASIEYDKLNAEAKGYVDIKEIIEVFTKHAKDLQNVREIQSLIKELIADQILENIQ
ncbi:AAA family ATPase [Owenweeksia hongkongensis]|uniref:AAA family ATPase n=1 Tax=Owenweeksia hongkongensis TaxID=253245 RepID=UPI003A94885B